MLHTDSQPETGIELCSRILFFYATTSPERLLLKICQILNSYDILQHPSITRTPQFGRCSQYGVALAYHHCLQDRKLYRFQLISVCGLCPHCPQSAPMLLPFWLRHPDMAATQSQLKAQSGLFETKSNAHSLKLGMDLQHIPYKQC